MSESQRKLANKTKMLSYWESELKESKDKEAIQATINRLNNDIAKLQSLERKETPVTHEPKPQLFFEEFREIPAEKYDELVEYAIVNPVSQSSNTHIYSTSRQPNGLQNFVDVFGLDLVKLKIEESDTITEQHKADMLAFIKYRDLLQNPLMPTDKTTLVFDKCQTIDLTKLDEILKKWEVVVTNSKLKDERKYVIEKMKFIFENW